MRLARPATREPDCACPLGHSKSDWRGRWSVGVPKEIQVHEHRVDLRPKSVPERLAHGHRVIVETPGRSGGSGWESNLYTVSADTYSVRF